ncbi:DNA glycosylase [Lentithecium fluviatile CBS 122367]|uniref:DNA glycosylase n=1 Tax=Lentithecium fluviatile CBS 122367 TaxID=1168545 RepID=A0A6G1JJP9_9PLEO|nr:DNA glycosylase [Lentithecium fluviatile CBS 122367]
MSLRRSARISSNTVSEPPAVEQASHTKANKSTETRKKRKARSSTAKTTTSPRTNGTTVTEDANFAIPSLPATPLPKRRKPTTKNEEESPTKPPPFTPTPSGVGLLATAETDHPLESLSNPKPRPADPHATNAPLATPGGSRVMAYTSSPVKTPTADTPSSSPEKKKKARKSDLPPDVGALHPATSTTETLLQDACEHLCTVDPKLRPLVEKHHCGLFSPEGLREVVDPFTALASGIIGQQVSGQAAASIKKKFTALFEETHPAFPTPAQVLKKDLPTLRTAGLSERKAEYISGLAEKFASGEFTAQMLISASDEDLIEKLVAVRGLGRWSVEMFACFGLKRMDVFSTGDLGVQRGMATYMGRNTSKLKAKGGKWKYMGEQEMLSIASRFSPYRSLFMWYMWRIEDVDISVMQSG